MYLGSDTPTQYPEIPIMCRVAPYVSKFLCTKFQYLIEFLWTFLGNVGECPIFGIHVYLKFKNRVAQKLGRIILPHCGLVTFISLSSSS